MLKLLASAMLVVPAFAQLDSYTVTVGASRSLKALPDQAALSVRLVADFNAGFDDILAALKNAGITATNLTGVSFENITTITQSGTVTTQQPVWDFSLQVPLSAVNSTMAMLENLTDSIQRQNNNWRLIYSVLSLTTSAQSTAQCSFQDLMADARADAQQLASAIGFGVGQVLALGDATEVNRIFRSGQQEVAYAILSFIPAANIGSVITNYLPQPSFFSSSSNATDCSIAVKFKLVPTI